jgi:hypothetical protein
MDRRVGGNGNLVLILVLADPNEFALTGKGQTAMTVTEAASELGVLRQSVLKMVKIGRLVPAAWWDGKMLFLENEIRNLKAAREAQP